MLELTSQALYRFAKLKGNRVMKPGVYFNPESLETMEVKLVCAETMVNYSFINLIGVYIEMLEWPDKFKKATKAKNFKYLGEV